MRILITAVILGAFVLACGPSASSSPSVASPQVASTAPSQAPAGSQAAGSGIVLERTGPIGCDTIGVDYTSATIKIDAASDPDVWAETDTANKLAVKWTAGFQPVDAGASAIRGPKGEEVARDGTKIDLPADGSYPRLAGYFVCLGTDALYILEADPQ